MKSFIWPRDFIQQKKIPNLANILLLVNLARSICRMDDSTHSLITSRKSCYRYATALDDVTKHIENSRFYDLEFSVFCSWKNNDESLLPSWILSFFLFYFYIIKISWVIFMLKQNLLPAIDPFLSFALLLRTTTNANCLDFFTETPNTRFDRYWLSQPTLLLYWAGPVLGEIVGDRKLN